MGGRTVVGMPPKRLPCPSPSHGGSRRCSELNRPLSRLCAAATGSQNQPESAEPSPSQLLEAIKGLKQSQDEQFQQFSKSQDKQMKELRIEVGASMGAIVEATLRRRLALGPPLAAADAAQLVACAVSGTGIAADTQSQVENRLLDTLVQPAYAAALLHAIAHSVSLVSAAGQQYTLELRRLALTLQQADTSADAALSSSATPASVPLAEAAAPVAEESATVSETDAGALAAAAQAAAAAAAAAGEAAAVCGELVQAVDSALAMQRRGQEPTATAEEDSDIDGLDPDEDWSSIKQCVLAAAAYLRCVSAAACGASPASCRKSVARMAIPLLAAHAAAQAGIQPSVSRVLEMDASPVVTWLQVGEGDWREVLIHVFEIKSLVANRAKAKKQLAIRAHCLAVVCRVAAAVAFGQEVSTQMFGEMIVPRGVMQGAARLQYGVYMQTRMVAL